MEKEKKQLFENQDWENIIKELTLYAKSRFKFWNLLHEKGVKGYSPEEITYQAIELVLAGKWNWNPNKSDLLPYLKFHVVKGLVANLARNNEVKKSSSKEIKYLNYTSNSSEEEEFNAKQVLELIKAELHNEKLLFKIFIAIHDGMKRNEICEYLDIKISDYNNQIRRLKSRLLKMNEKQLFDSLTYKK